MSAKLYPLLFEPVYQGYIWGGDRIIQHFHRDAPPGVYAESWEVSDRSEGMSVVANGSLAGTSLADVIREHGAHLLGTAVGDDAERFPLLIKLIDARETLSVQVHPDDDTAARYGGEAKTEMWYVLEAEPDACVYAGLKPDVDEAAVRDAIAGQTLDRLLNVVPVKAGDAVFMPGGRVHAIGAGCLLLEVQQNSNTTYRLYDWGRVGDDGQPRPLHIEDALRVTRWREEAAPVVTPRRLGQLEDNEVWEVLSCPYFRMERLLVRAPWPSAHDGQSFQVLFCEDRPVDVVTDEDRVRLVPGGTVLIPASVAGYTLEPVEGDAAVLRVTGPRAGV